MAISEEQLLERLATDRLVEGPDTASERYLEGLKRTLVVSADTELVSAPAYRRAARSAPTINAAMSATGIVQDELGHAHIAYRMLRDLGVDTDELVFERDAKRFKYPYAFDVPLDSWADLVVANTFYDRAGFVLLGDIFANTSYGPWKRALVKVDREETFHLRHGERWITMYAQDPEKKAEVQASMDWMFVLTLEWFGLPDDRKQHGDQMAYRLKGKTNDELRQTWMASVVPLCEKLGYRVPAHRDAETGHYIVDCPFPMHFDAERKEWDLGGAIDWDDVLVRWKARGPANEEYVRRIQRGYRQLRAAERAAA